MSLSQSKKGNGKTSLKRLLAFILALLMILGVAFYVIVLLAAGSKAALINDSDDYEDINVRVGIMYGTGVTDSYWVSTVGGFTFGSQKLTNQDQTFVKQFTIDESNLIIANDANIYYSEAYGTYVDSTTGTKVDIGGYHIETLNGFSTYEEALSFYNAKKSGLLEICKCTSFIAYINGQFKIRIGSFSTKESAVASLSTVSNYLQGYELKVCVPSSTGVTVISANTRSVIFEYDCEYDSYLGIKPTLSTSYIKAPTSNLYSGVFAFKRYSTIENKTKYDGVSVINVLPLEDYVAGVLPYECSGYWPLETLKAFAIAVRSYTISVLGRHNASYACDTCTSTHCQVYSGVNLITDTVIKAVKETRGQVMTSEGQLCCAYYSSSVGGITVNVEDAWGGSASAYLKAVRTPWEDYVNHSNGLWTSEVSGADLLVYLRDTKGYKELAGTKISDIKVLEYAKDSTYIKKIEFVDDKGNSIIINNTDKVRSVLGAYCKSSNFVVSKGSVEYVIDVVRETPVDDISYDINVPDPIEHPFASSITNMVSYSVKTGEDISTASRNDEEFISVITGTGISRVTSRALYVLTKDNAAYFGIDIPIPSTEDDENDNVFSVLQHMKKEASTSDNFIFVGKGWGHGVGMSQYGAYDLAFLGYNYLEILDMYFTDIEIVDFKTLE